MKDNFNKKQQTKYKILHKNNVEYYIKFIKINVHVFCLIMQLDLYIIHVENWRITSTSTTQIFMKLSTELYLHEIYILIIKVNDGLKGNLVNIFFFLEVG